MKKIITGMAVVIGSLIAIAYGIHFSETLYPLWGLLPLLFFISDFHWNDEKTKEEN